MRRIQYLSRMKKQEGATAVIVAVSVFVLIALAALAVDIGYVAVTKNELQNVADASALAAARQLGNMYEQKLAVDETTVTDTAQAVALENVAGGKNIAVNGSDVVIGDWDTASKSVVAPAVSGSPHAVQVTALRTTGTNDPLNTFFASLLGVSTVPVSAKATAELTGICESKNPLPIGLAKRWFTQSPTFCNQPVQFYPTNNSCSGTDYTGLAGWTNLSTTGNVNASALKKLLKDIQDGKPTPEVTAGEDIGFTGGTDTSVLKALADLFDAKKTSDATSPTGYSWETTIVIYDSDCGNPNQKLPVLGFATLVITDVIPTGSNHQVRGYVKCGEYQPEHGGCFSGGINSIYPVLVQ